MGMMSPLRPTQSLYVPFWNPPWWTRTMMASTFCAVSIGTSALGGGDLVVEAESGDPGRAHDGRCALEGHADEGDLGASDGADGVRREERLAAVDDVDVGRQVLEGATREGLVGGAGADLARGAAVLVGGVVATTVLEPEQVGRPVVELVIADRADVELHRVHDLDGRLVVVGRGDQRAGADQVARGDERACSGSARARR